MKSEKMKAKDMPILNPLTRPFQERDLFFLDIIRLPLEFVEPHGQACGTSIEASG